MGGACVPSSLPLCGVCGGDCGRCILGYRWVVEERQEAVEVVLSLVHLSVFRMCCDDVQITAAVMLTDWVARKCM